jgi:malate dehydrogenase
MATVAVLGVGRIGGEVAYLTSVLGLADELIMYDSAQPFLRSQVADLRHTGLDIPVSTDWRQVKKSDICIFSAGTPRNPGIKTRADLLMANLPVASECSRALRGFSGVLITVTNPMDANNYYLCRTTGLDPSRCIGFGGQLDSARFGLILAERGIPGASWVIGEHGEHQVPLFSRLGRPVEVGQRDEILALLRGASMEIIRGKGGTVFGPAYHVASLVSTILADRKTDLSCSCVLQGEYGLDRCSLGVPAAVGREGILRIHEWDLDPWEAEHLHTAGLFVKDLCSTFEVPKTSGP